MSKNFILSDTESKILYEAFFSPEKANTKAPIKPYYGFSVGAIATADNIWEKFSNQEVTNAINSLKAKGLFEAMPDSPDAYWFPDIETVQAIRAQLGVSRKIFIHEGMSVLKKYSFVLLSFLAVTIASGTINSYIDKKINEDPKADAAKDKIQEEIAKNLSETTHLLNEITKNLALQGKKATK